MIIKVEIQNDMSKDRVFWQGPGEKIMNIKNIAARVLAGRVLKNGITRSNSMWVVSEVKEKD